MLIICSGYKKCQKDDCPCIIPRKPEPIVNPIVNWHKQYCDEGKLNVKWKVISDMQYKIWKAAKKHV